MAEKNLPSRIIEAINADDEVALKQIFNENPAELDVQTFMGGQTWLGYACQKGKLAAVQCLLTLGARPEIGDKHDGAQPICSAARFGHADIVVLLLQHGVPLEVDASVRNPLFAAVVGRSPESVELLLAAGIDSRARYNSSTMADMDAVAFALMRGEQQCAEIIARWNARGDEGEMQRALAIADKIANINAYRKVRH